MSNRRKHFTPRHRPTPRQITRTLDDLLFDGLEFVASKIAGMFRRTKNATHHKR